MTISILYVCCVSCRLDRLERHYQHVHLDMDNETLFGMLHVICSNVEPLLLLHLVLLRSGRRDGNIYGRGAEGD